MSDEKRPVPADAAPASPPDENTVSLPQEVESDLFPEEDHDGWSEIKRRPSDSGTRT